MRLDEWRPITFERDYTYAQGSVLVPAAHQALCTAMVRRPRWMRNTGKGGSPPSTDAARLVAPSGSAETKALRPHAGNPAPDRPRRARCAT